MSAANHKLVAAAVQLDAFVGGAGLQPAKLHRLCFPKTMPYNGDTTRL
jgi:hypothetical protein